ncbi:MAG: hypothetical protein HPY70_12680 [Firmicutes bacterium]|nr:hypothetical protein [Bacillota bacterium]
MTVTDSLIMFLRTMIDEVIPEGGTDKDTRFTNDFLTQVLTEASSLEEAAAILWEIKAARAFSERGGIEETRAGDESIKYVSLAEYRDHCEKMANHYRQKTSGYGSRLFGLEAPEVGGLKEVVEEDAY